MVEQDGLLYCVNQISDVIDHGLPMVCGLYYTIQIIRHHKYFIATSSHKDLSRLLCIQLVIKIMVGYTDYVVYPVVQLILKLHQQKTCVRTLTER